MVPLRCRQLLAICFYLTVGLLSACSGPQAADLTPQGNRLIPTAQAAVSRQPSAVPDQTAVNGPPSAAPPTPTSQTPTVTATATPLPAPTVTPQPTPCAEPGRVEAGTFSSVTMGDEHRYNIYLPPCYGLDGRAYPVLYLLAGNIHDEHKWDELGIDEAAENAISAADAPPLLIVMPDGGWLANNTSGGPGSYETLILDELIPHVEATYCAWADPTGRAIGGLSRGGYWALETAFRFPHLFASAGGHSAALLDSFAGPALNPQHTALSNDLGDLLIYLDIGADDHVRANIIKLHQDMESAGVPHDWHLNEGQHVDAYWAAHTSDYLAWYVAPWSRDRASYPLCSTAP